MTQELKNKIIAITAKIYKERLQDVSEKRILETAEDLINNILELWDDNCFGMSEIKAKEVIKERIAIYFKEMYNDLPMSESEIEQMAEAVFSEETEGVFPMPEVRYVKRVLTKYDKEYCGDEKKAGEYENGETILADEHIRGIRLRISLFASALSDDETLFSLFQRLYYAFFQGSEALPCGRDFYRLFNTLKDILEKVYKYNLHFSYLSDDTGVTETDDKDLLCNKYNCPLLTEIIDQKYTDIYQSDNYRNPFDAILLISHIEELFEDQSDEIRLDGTVLRKTIEKKVKKHVPDKFVSEIVDLIMTDPLYTEGEDMPGIPHEEDVLELTIPAYGPMSNEFALKGDIFDDIPSDRDLLKKMFFEINDRFINGSETVSEKDKESITRLRDEIEIILKDVFKDYEENENQAHIIDGWDVPKRKRSERKKIYRSKDIYSLYREIALEFAEGNPRHVGIYHALYAIAVIVEKLPVEELIFETGDYDQPESSDRNKKILAIRKVIKDYADNIILEFGNTPEHNIQFQSILCLFPLYKEEINADLENATHSREMLDAFEEATLTAHERKQNSEDEAQDEYFADSDEGRFWIISFYVIRNGLFHKLFINKEPSLPLLRAIHYNPPAFDVLEGIGNKTVDFKNAVDVGEIMFKALIEGFEKEGDTFSAIVGQDAAIRKFTDAYEYALMFNKKVDRPQAVYLFVGPPGVGKTMLAENAASLLERPFKRFDMSEYSDSGSDGGIHALIGFEKTWKNSQPGVLTTFVDDHPNAILLFDEIEKAGKAVARLFLSILEGARLTDKYTEKTVSFSKTILIFTTNAGKDLYEDNQNTDLSTISDEAVIEALRGTNKKKEPKNAYEAQLMIDKHMDAFPPELVSRFATSNIILFNHLDGIALKDLAKTGFRAVREETAKSAQLQIDLGDEERLSYAYMFSQGKPDARVLSSGSRKFLGGKVRDAFKEAGNKLSGIELRDITISFSVDTDHINGNDNEREEIANLFPPAEDEAVSERKKVSALYVTDAKETNAGINWLEIENVSTYHDFRDQLDKRRNPYDMIIIDLSTGNNTDIYNGEAEGIKCLDALADIPGSQVLCVVPGKGIKLTDHDRENIISRGVSKILSENENDESWADAATDTFIKRSIRLLSDYDYVLDFDTVIESEKKDIKGIIQVKLTNLRYKEAEVEDADTRREDMQSLVSESGRPKVKFDDIIGADSAKLQLQDIIEYVKNPAKYDIMNCSAPRGLLLHGYPGTGKTMLAKALAGESKMAFIATTGSELVSKGPDGVKYIFDLARRKRKAIIFIDEFDALGSKRTGEQTYKEFAVNRLLTEMDGFSSDKKRLIFVVAATNAAYNDRYFGIPVKIDKAVERRFGKSLVIELPSKENRIKFIKKRLDDMNQSIGDNTVNVAADLTIGRSLAVIESYLQNCIRHAIRDSEESEEKVGMTEDRFLNYLQEELFGDSNERKKPETDQTKIEKENDPLYHVAIHEAGHALISCISGDEPAILTISGRGNYGGFYQRAEESLYGPYTQKELLNSIDLSLAGGVAETVIFGEDLGTTTGVSSDLENATGIARDMITKYGMTVGKSNNIGVIKDGWLGLGEKELILGDTALSKEIWDDVNSVLHNEKEKTKDIIEKNKDILIELADKVYDDPKGKKYLTGKEIKDICSKAKQ